MIRIINFIRATFFVCLLTLSACAEQPIFKDIPILENVETFLAKQLQKVSNDQNNDNLNDDLEEVTEKTPENKLPPISGDFVTVQQYDPDKIYDVKIEKLFHAASGRLCFYYFESDKPAKKDPTGLACISDDHRWIKIPLKVIRNTS